MSFTGIGFLELLAILTQLGSFGVDANPKAAPAAEIMKYAPAQPDYIVYADLQAVLPNNYKALVGLPGKLKSPAAQASVRKLIKQIEQTRGFAKGLLGMDPITDLKSVAVFVKPDRKRGLQFIAAIRGKFPTTLLRKVASLTQGSTVNVGGSMALNLPGGMGLAALAKDGTLLVGSSALVKARLNPKWKAAKRPRGSTGAKAARVFRGKPFFSLISSPSAVAKRGVQRRVRGAGAFVRDLLTGHKFAQLSLAHNGISWTWADVGPAGYKRAVLASEGALQVFRAMHFAARGVVKFGFAALGSYAGKHKLVDLLLKHQKQLLKVVTQVTGNGRFKVRWRKDPRNHTVSVRAWAKELTQVIPLAAVIPGIAAAAYLGVSKSESRSHHPHPRAKTTSSSMAKPMFRAPVPRLDVRRTYRKVKKTYLN